MATLTRGQTFTTTVTATMLHNLVDQASISNIQSADVADAAITSGKIAADAVTTEKIQDSSVTAAKLGATTIKKIIPVNPVTALTITGGSTATWADLDLTSLTSANATWVQLRCFVKDSAADGIGMSFRKDSDSATAMVVVTNMVSSTRGMYAEFWMPMATGQVIQHSREAGGSGTLGATVTVLAYMEDFV